MTSAAFGQGTISGTVNDGRQLRINKKAL
jgi:hypothetical protein